MKRIYIIAIVSAVLAGITLFNFLNMVKKEAKVHFDTVIVTATDVEANTIITADMLTTKQVPTEGIHGQAVREANDAIGKIATEKLYRDEQILLPRLKKMGEKTGGMLSYTIPNNMRAITVAVDEISGIAGFIKPGDRVDILGVLTVQNGDKSEQTSTMFLQNIEVLAIGKTLNASANTTDEKDKGENSGDNASSSYASVTLLTTPEDAVRLNLLTATGAMRIILRGPTDEEITTISPKNANNATQ